MKSLQNRREGGAGDLARQYTFRYLSPLIDIKAMLHFFEGEALGFRIEKHDDQELQDHHCRKKDERKRAGCFGHDREKGGNDGVHDPVG